MRTFGLIGHPLSHSFSKKYFEQKFREEGIKDCVFENFDVEDIRGLPALQGKYPSLCGLSVTIPHKETVMSLLDELDEPAQKIGAVNCIRIRSGKLKGFNTDAFGFKESLKPLLAAHHKKALVLGTGGAAKAVRFALNELRIDAASVSRKHGNAELTYAGLDRSALSDRLLIVNCTPLGMHPNANECPGIPYEFISGKHLMYDLIYNPEKTLFLKKGKEKGAQIKNGLQMLELQAERSWKIWNSE